MQLVESLGSPLLSREHLAAGIALAQYYLAEALRIHIIGLDDPDLLLAEKLLRWFTTEWPKRGPSSYLSLPDIYQFGPVGIRDKNTTKRIVAILEDHGHVRRHDRAREINGVMRREVWEIQAREG